MKNKILAVLGGFLIIASIVAWYAYTVTIRENSELLGTEILVLAENIPEGEAFTEDNVVSKKIKRSDIMDGALTLDDIVKLEGKVAAINLYKNEQITKERLTTKEFVVSESVQVVAIPIDSAVKVFPGDLFVGEFVDVWSTTSGENGLPGRLLENVRIVGLRDANNYDISGNHSAVPASVIVQANFTSEIVALRGIDSSHLFISKNPNQTGIKLKENKTEITEEEQTDMEGDIITVDEENQEEPNIIVPNEGNNNGQENDEVVLPNENNEVVLPNENGGMN